jgi:hypothetical protein
MPVYCHFPAFLSSLPFKAPLRRVNTPRSIKGTSGALASSLGAPVTFDFSLYASQNKVAQFAHEAREYEFTICQASKPGSKPIT